MGKSAGEVHSVVYMINLGRRERVPCSCGDVSLFCASLLPQPWMQDKSHILVHELQLRKILLLFCERAGVRMQTSLTGEEIDRLSGRKLREAVALSLGWTVNEFGGWSRPGTNRRTGFPVWHTDQGAALGLLMGVKMPASSEFSATLPIAIAIFSDAVSVIRHGETLASGPIAECASVLCRAYLKLVNGE